MSLFDQLLSPAPAESGGRDAAQRLSASGVVIGVVTNIQDPDSLARVRVKFPWLSEEDESGWARVATLMAGKERGTVFLPEVDDEVLVAFEHGDMRRPVVIGALWNGVDVPPPEFASDGKNNVRLIKSRSGHVVKLDDTDGSERIEIVDKTGKNSVVIDSAANTVTITTDQDLVLKAENGKISLSAKDVELKASGGVKVESGSAMDLKSGAALNAKGSPINLN